LAKKGGVSRSAFVRHAVEQTLQESAETRVLEKAYQIYAEIAEEDRKLSEALLPLAAETLPPRTKRFPRRGEIYFVDFPATGADEIAGPHPALIVQNDVGNRASRLTIVAAVTSNLRVARLPVGVQVSPKESALPRPSVVHLGHLYTIDKGRLGRPVGRLPHSRLREVDLAIQIRLRLRPFEMKRVS
jgi:mRNA interferase MazF